MNENTWMSEVQKRYADSYKRMVERLLDGIETTGEKEATMQVTYNGFTGELVKLEREGEAGKNFLHWRKAGGREVQRRAGKFQMRKRFEVLLAAAIMLLSVLTACSEADKVNANLSKDADYFNCERRITVYNARTDNVILTVEGYMSVSNNSASELVVTCKTGSNEYKKNYVYLNDYTLYVVEDITGTHTDPYHYQMYFHTEFPVTVDMKP